MLRAQTLRFILVLAMLGTAGCGRYYWTQPGRDLGAFTTDSQACMDEVRAMKAPAEPATIYRYCMAKQGWRRTQLVEPQAGAYRGPEREEEVLGTRPVVQAEPGADAARRTECQRRMRNITFGPRYVYDEEFNRCMGR
jgi:hypothetical protein